MVLGYKQIRFFKINITELFLRKTMDKGDNHEQKPCTSQNIPTDYVLITDSKYTVLLILTSQAQRACIQKRLGFLQKPVHFIYIDIYISKIMCVCTCVCGHKVTKLTR